MSNRIEENITSDKRQELADEMKKDADGTTVAPGDNDTNIDNDRFVAKVDAHNDDVPDEMRGLMALSCKEMVPFYPAGQKPYKDYESLRDACYNDFQSGEGMENLPYLDCAGHLTIGVGILLNHKKKGERDLKVEGKSRFDLYGFDKAQKEAAIKATELLNPNDYMNKHGVFIVEKIDETTGDTYHVNMERIEGAGARVLWVQKNDEKIVRMPFIKQNTDKKVFDKVFKNSFGSVQCCPSLYTMPREMQMSLIHQVWGRGRPPDGTNSIRTPQQAFEACNRGIQERINIVGTISQGEKNQIARARSYLDITYDNALHGRTIRGESVRPTVSYDKKKEEEAYKDYKNKALDSYRRNTKTGDFMLPEVVVSASKGKHKKKDNSDDTHHNFIYNLFHKKDRGA